MRHTKTIYAVLTASLMAAALTFPALASERIEDITMEIESWIYAGGYGDENDLEVIVDNDGCYVDSVTVTNVPSDEEWEEGDKPKVRIVLMAEDDYTFASGLGKNDVALDEDEGTVTSVSRSSSKLTINVTLAELDYDDDYYDDDDEDQNLDVEDLGWDSGDGGIAWWEGLDYARRYDVRLYRDGSAITDVISTTDTYYNFSQYFTKAGSYTFKVRGVRSTSNTGSWQESEEQDVSSSEAAYIKKNGGGTTAGSGSGGSGSGAAVNLSGGWVENPGVGWWWCNPDRSYPVSSWMQLDGRWYYFDANGYCVMNGWAQINGCWYYFNASGHCVMNEWVQTSGKWYYCGSDGAMLTSQMIDGRYYVNVNGEWVQ